MRGGSSRSRQGPLTKATDEARNRYKMADMDLAQRKKLINESAERWFSENPGKLYDIALLDVLPGGHMKEYTKEVFNSYNIYLIITGNEPGLLPIGINTIMSFMDWVNRNPGKEPHFSENENRIIRYIKEYIKEYPRMRRAIKHGVSYEKISDALKLGSDAVNSLNDLIVFAAAKKREEEEEDKLFFKAKDMMEPTVGVD